MAWLLFHGCPVSCPQEDYLCIFADVWQSGCFLKACAACPMAAVYGRMRGDSGEFSGRLAVR
jgi:hypothetical protein